MFSMSTDHHFHFATSLTMAARGMAIAPLLMMMIPLSRCTASSPFNIGYEAVDAVIPNHYYYDHWFDLRPFPQSSFAAFPGPAPQKLTSSFKQYKIIQPESKSHTEDNKEHQSPSSQRQSPLASSEVKFFSFIAGLIGFTADVLSIGTFVQGLFTSSNAPSGGDQATTPPVAPVDLTPILNSMNNQFDSVQQQLNSIVANQQLGEIGKYIDVEMAVLSALNDMQPYNQNQSVALLQNKASDLFDKLDYFLRGMLGQNSLSADILNITAVLSHCNNTAIGNLAISYITIVNYGMVSLAYYSQLINNPPTDTIYNGQGKLSTLDAKRTLVHQRLQAVQATCGRFANSIFNTEHDKKIYSISSAISSTLNQFDENHYQQQMVEKGLFSFIGDLIGFAADAMGIASFVQGLYPGQDASAGGSQATTPPVAPVDLTPILNNMTSQFNSVKQQLSSIIAAQQLSEIEKYNDVEKAVVGALNDMQPYNQDKSVALLQSRASNLFDKLDYFLRGMLGQNSLSVDILNITIPLSMCNSTVIDQQIKSYITTVNFGMAGLAYYSQVINNPATKTFFNGNGKIVALDAKRTLVNQRLLPVLLTCLGNDVTSVLSSVSANSNSSDVVYALQDKLLDAYQQVANTWFIFVANNYDLSRVALVGFRMFSVQTRIIVVAPFNVRIPQSPLQLNQTAIKNYIDSYWRGLGTPDSFAILSTFQSNLFTYFIGRQPTCMLLSPDQGDRAFRISTNFTAVPYLYHRLAFRKIIGGALRYYRFDFYAA